MDQTTQVLTPCQQREEENRRWMEDGLTWTALNCSETIPEVEAKKTTSRDSTYIKLELTYNIVVLF